MDKISWPSERIPHGGIFHQSSVNYSKETHDMIKSEIKIKFNDFKDIFLNFIPNFFLFTFIYLSALMSEANLTNLQCKKINYFLRQGSALPQLEMQKRKLPSEEYEMRRAKEIMDKSRVVRKRSWETIAKSGVFEIER